jgi:hypothetical protein
VSKRFLNFSVLLLYNKSSDMWWLSGWFLGSFESARAIAANLGIDLQDYEDAQLEWPINSWLHDNGMTNMKAAVMKWPPQAGRLGVFFISKFRRSEQEVAEEDEKDREVKNFLNEAGAKSLLWVQMLDTLGITLNGVEPEKSDYRRVQVSRGEFFKKLDALKPVKLEERV